jgi:hypothetical protein
LEYTNAIWYPYLKRQSIKIERIQRRATQLLEECNNMQCKDRFIHLQLHSLKGRRVFGDLIQMYKMFHGLDDIDVHGFFLHRPLSDKLAW